VYLTTRRSSLTVQQRLLVKAVGELVLGPFLFLER